MSKEPNNSEMAIAYGILSLFIFKHIVEILSLIIQAITHAAWSLSGAFGKLGKFIGPPLNLLATIATIIAVIWAIRKIHSYVNKITEFRNHLHEKVTELKSDLFKELDHIKGSLLEKAWEAEQRQLEFEQKTKALMESIEERFKAPPLIELSTSQEGVENSDSNVLPR